MRRRTFLAGTAALLPLALAGCVGGSGAGGPGDGTGTDAPNGSTPTAGPPTDAPSVRSASLTPVEGCPEASVAAGDAAVVCRGCARGANGCAVAVLDRAAYDADADELRVVVATQRGDAGGCTQALVSLGYEVRVELDGGLPGTVTLVEDDVDGRRTALAESL